MNKYLHTVASVGFLFTLNYDARNRELKVYIRLLTLYTEQSYSHETISVSVREVVSESRRLQTLCTPNWSIRLIFYVCVTVHQWYNNINSQLDATVIV